jgi:hypothetical protein
VAATTVSADVSGPVVLGDPATDSAKVPLTQADEVLPPRSLQTWYLGVQKVGVSWNFFGPTRHPQQLSGRYMDRILSFKL